jgi:hypothetical protein
MHIIQTLLPRRHDFLRFTIVSMLAIIGAAAMKPVAAGQASLLVNGKAVHLERLPGATYNEKNWGGGIQYDYDKLNNGWRPFSTVSGFNDSNRNMSYYAGVGAMRRFSLTNDLHVEAGGLAFVMTRKGFHDGDPFLGVLPAFSIGTDRIAVNMTFVPKIHPKSVPLLFFQLKIGLPGKT